MKLNFETIGNTMLNIISSTVVVLPFMIFLKWGSDHTFISILPFVIFYTFRTTGIFFIRGIKTKLNSYTLLKLAVYCGILGSIFGLLGVLCPQLTFIAGFFLGLSAAWLPMAKNTIQHYRLENTLTVSPSIGIMLLFFTLIGIVLMLPGNDSFVIFFVLYGIMYFLILPTFADLEGYEVTTHDLEGYSYRYLILFFVFFVLIFLLRSSRLLLNTMQFDYFVYGVFFFALCTLLFSIFSRSKPHRQVPRSLNYLTVLNGALGNYLFLFSSLYAAGFYGHSQLFTKFYLPYTIGIVVGPRINHVLDTRVEPIALVGILSGLIMILFTPLFEIGILVLSIFKSIFNSWLTNIYRYQDYLPKDKRLWVKYTVQGIGSIIHQFILMIIGSLLIFKNQSSIKRFFMVTSQKHPTATSKSLMENWNSIATGILLVAIIIYSINLMIRIKMKGKQL